MLRPIDISDAHVAARVVAIQRDAYRVEAELIGFDGIPPLHETVEDLFTLDLHWMGSWEDRVLVAIIAWSTNADVCEIDRLAVHPDHFRRGHGRALVASLLSLPTVVVSTGTKNTPACQLYESLGFVPSGQREIAPGVSVTEFRRSS